MRCPAWRTARWRSCAARRASGASTSSRSTATARCPDGIRSGEAAGRPLPGDRRPARPGRHGADLRDRTARLGRHRGRSAASRLHGVRPRSGRGRRLRRRRAAPQRTCATACNSLGCSRSAAPPAARGCTSSCRSNRKRGWDAVKPFCRASPRLLSEAQPERFLSTVKKVDRRGRILIDWLRNGLGATAVASFCPRARPGATVATPLAWEEVSQKLDPSVFTVHSVPERLARQRIDPWEGFAKLRQCIPDVSAAASGDQPKGVRQPEPALQGEQPAGSGKPASKTVIVSARKPKRRA